MSRRAKKQARDTKDDQKQVAIKRKEYADYGWKDRGVLVDLKNQFQMTSPNCDTLRAIAVNLSVLTNIKLDHQDKRRREFLVGWCNKHYDVIGPILKRLTIVDDSGEMRGSNKGKLEEYMKENPEVPLVVYIKNEIRKEEE
jgi:hypothetical protein